MEIQQKARRKARAVCHFARQRLLRGGRPEAVVPGACTLLRRAELKGRIEACRQLWDEAAEVGDLRAIEFMHRRMVGHEIELWLMERADG